MNLRESCKSTERHLKDLGRRIDTDYLQFASRSSSERKRRALLVELGEQVASVFDSEPDRESVIIEYDDVRALLDDLSRLDAPEAPASGPRPLD